MLGVVRTWASTLAMLAILATAASCSSGPAWSPPSDAQANPQETTAGTSAAAAAGSGAPPEAGAAANTAGAGGMESERDGSGGGSGDSLHDAGAAGSEGDGGDKLDAADANDGGAGTTGGEPALPPFVDPGTAPWEPVPEDDIEEVCGLDPALLAQADVQLNVPWAIVRHGRLCHEFYPPGQTPTSAGEVYSTTKSLGAAVVGLVNYQTRDLPRTGPKTGRLRDWDRADHWLDSFSYNPDAHVAHVLAMVGHNADLSWGNKPHAYDTVGDVQINSLSEMVNAALAQDPERLGSDIEEFTRQFLYEPLGMKHSRWSDDAPSKVFSYTWSSTVRDMLRVGLLVLNRGVWNGQRLMAEEWVYKMTHPAFEDGNTAYGYLTWLSSRSNHSIGFSPPTSQGPSVPCAPAALWNRYPHGELSEADDCNYEPPASCEQQYDVGVWQAVGFMGMVIQGHPGLDLVLVAKNEALGGAGLWPAVLPAIVAKDPIYPGDQTAFCEAYSANRHAPDYQPWSVYQ